jgi:hypothetical protein
MTKRLSLLPKYDLGAIKDKKTLLMSVHDQS